MIRRLICLEWNTSTECRFCSELDAALALEMTSSCNKSGDIPEGEIRGFGHLLLNCLRFLRKALQKTKERHDFQMFQRKIEQAPLPSPYPITFQVH